MVNFAPSEEFVKAIRYLRFYLFLHSRCSPPILKSKSRKYDGRGSVISRITGMTRETFPLWYLGVPIIQGRIKTIYFDHVVEKIRRKIDGWKVKLLSFGGRLTLIKAVLSSLTIHTLSSTVVPKNILRRLERLMANFLWNVQGVNRTHWIRWTDICQPIGEGGLGILRIEQIMNGLQAKLMWSKIPQFR